MRKIIVGAKFADKLIIDPTLAFRSVTTQTLDQIDVLAVGNRSLSRRQVVAIWRNVDIPSFDFARIGFASDSESFRQGWFIRQAHCRYEWRDNKSPHRISHEMAVSWLAQDNMHFSDH